MSSFRVESISAYDFARGVLPETTLPECAGWQVHSVLTPSHAAEQTARILSAREQWTRDPEGDIVTLGEAWYLHFENGTTAAYFDGADESDVRVERVIPGAAHLLRDFAARAVGRPVDARPLWCGPGAHVLEAKTSPFRGGGCAHFDTEGLREEHCRALTPAISVVLMLSAPEQGGGLRLWDHRYDPRTRKSTFDDLTFKRPPTCPFVDVTYAPGDLLVFDSYRLHRILPARGKRPRISLTLHAVQNGLRWESWF